MCTAQHPSAPLLFARAVLARHQAQVARHVRRATEAHGVIQSGDIRRRRDGPHAGMVDKPGDDGLLGRDRRTPVQRLPPLVRI